MLDVQHKLPFIRMNISPKKGRQTHVTNYPNTISSLSLYIVDVLSLNLPVCVCNCGVHPVSVRFFFILFFVEIKFNAFRLCTYVRVMYVSHINF